MPENTAGERVNRTKLAALHGVSLPTVDSWVRAGMPYIKRGGKGGLEWEFDPSVCYEWRMQRELDKRDTSGKRDEDVGIDDLEKRKLLAQTVEAELKVAKARGVVAEVAVMERNLARAFAMVRANLRNIPARAVSLLIGETDERRFKAILLQEIDNALEVLAGADLTAEDDENEDE